MQSATLSFLAAVLILTLIYSALFFGFVMYSQTCSSLILGQSIPPRVTSAYPIKTNWLSQCDFSSDPLSDFCKSQSIIALKQIGNRVIQLERKLANLDSSMNLKEFGNGWGVHTLNDTTDTNQERPCVFYSYGISNDWSFDSDVSQRWKCTGFLLDPSITHSSILQPGNLHFFQLGAPMLTSESNTVSISPPQLMAALGHSFLNVLKMDCEGCEYALYRDISLIKHDFLSSIGQFSVEVHLSKIWAPDDIHVIALGLLYAKLIEAGFELNHVDITGCHPKDEEPGCADMLLNIGYPCGLRKMCQNYLFTRPSIFQSQGL